ncbi:MAG: alkaline shock response membrane anchor protein AmaP [Candidatus Omnitrophica bacterium]|nr:alkaline shock response membrane anchor protein AmaP [Candidatus Omnitrophota bacterium]
MRFFTVLGIIFYTTVLSLIGLILIIVSLNWISIETINTWLQYFYTGIQVKFILGSIGVLLILISISFAQLILGKIQKERTIAFSNPSGEITISLSAVEDLIGRIIRTLTEIKDVKPNVIATKKGIEIDLRISLKTELNIPEFTAHLQEMVRSKMEEILGIEEPIIIKIHVIKFSPHEEKIEDKKPETPSVPFVGYRKI